MIHLTDSAVREIKRLAVEKGLAEAVIRFGVETGGCSGLQYTLDFDDTATATDQQFDYDGLRVVCDGESLKLLDGLEVDFSDKLMGGGFKFQNPNARRACGCGTSFRV
jgi:iron-sulfur cluster assembly protein